MRLQLYHGFRHSLWATRQNETPDERAEIVEDRIGHRCDQERQEETQALATDDYHGDRTAFIGAWTSSDREGEHAGYECQGGHENGAQPVTVRHHNGFQALQTARCGWPIGHCESMRSATPSLLPLISMPSGGWVPHPKGIHDRPLLGEMVRNRRGECLFVKLAHRCRQDPRMR